MNIKEQWAYLDEMCAYWLELDEPTMLLLQGIASSLKIRTLLVDSNIHNMAVYGYDPSTGRLVIYIYIDHGLLTKHHSEYIMIEEVSEDSYKLHLIDGAYETSDPRCRHAVSHVKTTIEKSREIPPGRNVKSNHLPSYLTDRLHN